MKPGLQQTTKWLRKLLCAFFSAIAVFGGLALVATAVPSYAHDNDDDDGDQDRLESKGSRDFSIEVLSGRPDMIAGGDSLIQIRVKKKEKKISLDDVTVRLNGADITAQFLANHAARTLTGLVTGLRLGENRLTVGSDRKGRDRGDHGDADATLVNYPIEGPIISGPHEQPYACATQSFNLPAGLGNLGAALDANCSINRRVDYIYRTTANAFAQWPAGATTYPANMASTTTTLGKTVPYIIRIETGTINRAIYQITILHDPLTEPAPSWNSQPGNWNKRLIYTFGGGCIGGWYRQGSSTGGVTDNFMLSNGYALASSSLNVFGNNCNDLTASETMMMVKERFIEAYGVPAHTQGWGCSGGSYAQHQIGDNYPGLLEGIIPGCSFPEVGFATINFITDAWLLDNYFTARQAAMGWTDEQKRQVTGFLQYATAPNIEIGAHRIDPKPGTTSCASVPLAQRYDPATNLVGVRCTVYDHTVNVYGKDPATGFARRPLDNVGIQYGLKLVNDGTISAEQFVDLNEKIGGFDRDATIVPQRTVADLLAARAAYQTGRLTNGGGGLAEMPIIDFRDYNDVLPGGDIHVRYHSFSMRKRLEKANGRSDNQVMWVNDNRFGLYSNANPLLQSAILKMDRWITAIKADKRHIRQIEKVVQNKPADLQEGCYTKDPTPAFIAEHQVRGPSTCHDLYPSNSFPREVAGADIAADIIKCQTKPLRESDYAVTFTATQWTRLQAAFPSGVCDWSKPGYEQQDPLGIWLVID
jgi:uncharacterized tannase-like protein DUF6351